MNAPAAGVSSFVMPELNDQGFPTPLLLDGGLSTVLEAAGHDLNHALWSAKFLAENPEAIVQAHLRYLEAGAQAIITASYQASIRGFLAAGYDRATAEALLLKSVTVAEDAVERWLATQPEGTPRPLIAASLGPYGAYRADGSEYVGHYGIPKAELRAFHAERIAVLERSNADCYACETLPSFPEARVLAELLKTTQKPAWVSFSCQDDEHINDGTNIRDCADLFCDHPNVFAIGVNCTAPKYVSGLIRALQTRAGGKQIIVYPNSGQVWDPEGKRWIGLSEPKRFSALGQQWLSDGADLIGGCCTVGPAHIAALHDLLQAEASPSS